MTYSPQVSCGPAASQASTIGYTLTPLMGTQGDGTSFANAINSVGQVAGDSYSHLSDFPPFPQSRATLWNGTMATELGTLGGTASFASGINDAGHVAGWAQTSAGGPRHATVWDGTKPTDLGTLSGGTSSSALAINNAGQIVGYSWTTDAGIDPIGTPTTHAILWNGTTMTDLNSLLDPGAVS